MTDYEALLREARSDCGVQSASTVSEVGGLLVSLGAVHFEFNEYRDALNDEFVVWDLVAKAYTLTDSSLLRRLATDDEVEHITADPDEIFDPSAKSARDPSNKTASFRERHRVRPSRFL